MLLHRLEKGRLYFCRASVDLISKYEISENRALVHLESFVLLRIDHSTDHIGRKEIRSKLDPAELCIHGLRECIDGQSLRKARNTFEKDVSVCEQTYQKILHKSLLAYNHLSHLQGQHIHEGAFLLDAVVQFFNINVHINKF